jgi:AcrR family transcriptional regulator
VSIKEQRITEIIEAAMKVFGKHGFHRAKIEEIAKTAGIGKGTVYEYFDSKKDLFEQMIKHIGETYFNMAIEAMDTAETVKDKLIAFAQHHGNFISSHMDMAENIIPGAGFLSEEMKLEMIEMKKAIFLLVDKTLQKGIETGEVRSDINKRIATLCILGAINQNYTLQVYFKKISPKDVDPTPIIDTVFNGLASK